MIVALIKPQFECEGKSLNKKGIVKSEKAIASVVDKQIMKGYEDGSFKPEKAITRQQFAVIAYNYMNYKNSVQKCIEFLCSLIQNSLI